jgi:hypothetical protein
MLAGAVVMIGLVLTGTLQIRVSHSPIAYVVTKNRPQRACCDNVPVRCASILPGGTEPRRASVFSRRREKHDKLAALHVEMLRVYCWDAELFASNAAAGCSNLAG